MSGNLKSINIPSHVSPVSVWVNSTASPARISMRPIRSDKSSHLALSVFAVLSCAVTADSCSALLGSVSGIAFALSTAPCASAIRLVIPALTDSWNCFQSALSFSLPPVFLINSCSISAPVGTCRLSVISHCCALTLAVNKLLSSVPAASSKSLNIVPSQSS